MTVQEALEELHFLSVAALRKAEAERSRLRRGMSHETQERIAESYDRERDALQMAIDALKGRSP